MERRLSIDVGEERRTYLAFNRLASTDVALDQWPCVAQAIGVRTRPYGADTDLHRLWVAVKPLETAKHCDQVSGTLRWSIDKINAMATSRNQAVVFDPDDAHRLHG